MLFVSATNFRLVTGSTANTTCCIDKVTVDPGTPNKNHDVDKTTRPLGLGSDAIGR